MKKGYVVVEFGYQYNDEYYFREGEDYSIKSPVYLDKETADSICMQKEWQKYKGLYIGNYIENLSTIQSKKLNKILNTDFEEDDWDMQLPKDITLEKYKKIKKIIELDFFEVIEIDVSSEFQRD